MREQFPLLRDVIYFDNASAEATPLVVDEAVKQFLDDCLRRSGDGGLVLRELEESKRLFAGLMKTKPENVAASPNASTAMAALFSLPSFRRGVNIVLAEHNFPTSYHLWAAMKRRGLISEVRVAPYRSSDDLTDFESSLTMTRWLSPSIV